MTNSSSRPSQPFAPHQYTFILTRTRAGILLLQVRGALECSFRDAIGGTLGGALGCSFLNNAIGGSKRRPDLRPARPRSLHKTAPSL